MRDDWIGVVVGLQREKKKRSSYELEQATARKSLDFLLHQFWAVVVCAIAHDL